MLGLGYAAAGIGQDSAGGGAGVDSGGLEEIIVTAERRQADIQKTAIPMTAISGDEIAARGQTLVDEVLRDAPSVQIQKSPQGADIVVRLAVTRRVAFPRIRASRPSPTAFTTDSLRQP